MLQSFLPKTPSNTAVRHRLSPRCQAGLPAQSHGPIALASLGKANVYAVWNFVTALKRLSIPEVETGTMALTIPSTTSTHSVAAGQPPQPWLRLRDWLLADPRSQHDDIRTELLHQRSSKTKTLVVAVLGSLLIASIAAGLTGAKWAYAWVLAEVVLGSIRMSLMMNALANAKAGKRNATTIAPVWAGLTSVILISAGCYQCVGSGNWLL